MDDPCPDWTLLERVAPASDAWPTEAARHAGERAHFRRVVEPGQVEVEFLNGDRVIWPWAECRIVRYPDGRAGQDAAR